MEQPVHRDDVRALMAKIEVVPDPDVPHTQAGATALTLGTGSRAVAGVPAMTLPDPADPSQLTTLRRANSAARFRAEVGALGDALHRAGRTVATVGTGALLGGMTAEGRAMTS